MLVIYNILLEIIHMDMRAPCTKTYDRNFKFLILKLFCKEFYTISCHMRHKLHVHQTCAKRIWLNAFNIIT